MDKGIGYKVGVELDRYFSYDGYVEEIRYKGGIKLKEILVEYDYYYPQGYRNKGVIVGVSGSGYGLVQKPAEGERYEEKLVRGDVVVRVGGREYDLVEYLESKGCTGVGYLRELQVESLLTGVYEVGGTDLSELLRSDLNECEIERVEVTTKEGLEEIGMWLHTLKVKVVDMRGYSGSIKTEVLKTVRADEVYVEGGRVESSAYSERELKEMRVVRTKWYEGCRLRDPGTGKKWVFLVGITLNDEYVYELSTA